MEYTVLAKVSIRLLLIRDVPELSFCSHFTVAFNVVLALLVAHHVFILSHISPVNGHMKKKVANRFLCYPA